MEGQPEAEMELVEKPKLRQIIIETDGTKVRVTKTECSNLEARSIFQLLLRELGG